MVVCKIAKDSSLVILRTYLGLIRHVEPQYGFRSCKAASQHSSIATTDLVSNPYRASMILHADKGSGEMIASKIAHP